MVSPDQKTTDSPKLPTSGSSVAEVILPWLVDKPGQWSFQVIATSGGVVRQVGKVQELNFVEGPWWERWWKILTGILTVMLALINVVLFVLARRSAWAWQLATDDSLGTWVLRVATLLLSYIPKAQLWIIDLYFQRVRAILRPPRPFLPLPLTGSDGRVQASNEVAGPPWNGRRLWVQGASGMGKTALFRNITEAHFRDNETAYAAFARWRCILVAFPARDFAGSGEDKDDPAWVFDAVRATL